MTNDEEYLTSLGTRIKNLRKEKGINQSQLAGLSKIDKASLSRIEAGKINLTATTMKRISDALSLQLFEFFADGLAAIEKEEKTTKETKRKKKKSPIS